MHNYTVRLGPLQPYLETHACIMMDMKYSQGSRNGSIPSAPKICSEASSQPTLLRTPYFPPNHPTSSISVNLIHQHRSPIPELVANLQGCRFSRSQCTCPIPSQVAILRCTGFAIAILRRISLTACIQNSMHHFLLRGEWRGVAVVVS